MRFATAGTKIYIGAVMDDVDTDVTSTSFAAQTWVEIGGHTSIGSFGDTAAEVSAQEIGRARDIRQKGTRNAGTLTLTCNLNTTDAGQIALIAAEKTNFNYAFRVVFPDKPATGASPKGSERLFYGIVMAAPENLSTANQFAQLEVRVAINSNIVKIVASAT